MSTINDSDFQDFFSRIEAEMQEGGFENEEELKESLPKQDSREHGSLSLVKLDGLALTTSGELTRTDFFTNLEIDREKYGDIMLTADEARSLATTYRKLSTGMNAVTPLTCGGNLCPFSKSCWYHEHGKAPIGKPCLVEYDLLNFYTKKFMEEYDVKPEDFSEMLLIGELAETIVLEMRPTKVLSEPGNARMNGLQTKFSPQGDEIQEEVIHWAFELKERLKSRRMKILDALMGTRKSKASKKDDNAAGNPIQQYLSTLQGIHEVMREAQPATFTEVKEQ